MKDATSLKVQFKDRLIEWSEAGLDTKFGNLNNIQQSRQMIKFFVAEVLEKLYPGIVPEDEGELESCIVDGPGDGGADFLYRTDEGQVLVIQGKYRGKDAAESPESIGRFCDLPERLFLATEGKQQSLHKELIELASQIDWAEDSFRFYFITTAKSGSAVTDRVAQGMSTLKEFPDLVDERSEFRYLDNSALNQELREAISSADFADKPIAIPLLPDAEDRPWCYFQGKDRELYVGEVSGGVLATILQEHKASLFTMNIRDYVGDTKTNQRIISTALEDPTNFEYFNNGVAAVAAKITPDEEHNCLKCEKLSIINGAQTVRSLLAASRRKSSAQYKPIGSVRVLMRLMSFNYPTEVSFVGEVTRYNNTQNAVKIADFRSNDRVQKDLAQRFGSLNFNGRNFEYRNKRSVKKRNTISITLEELTKALYAFRFGPDDMFGGTGKLFDASSTGLYRKVFDSPEETLSEAEFNLIAGIYFACLHVKDLWEGLRSSLRSGKKAMHPALERKGIIFFAIGELERMAYGKQKWDLNTDLSRLAKPNSWMGDKASNPCSALAKAFEIAAKVIVQQYEIRQKNAAETFKHRNWFRDAATLDDIRSGLDLALAFGTTPKIW